MKLQKSKTNILIKLAHTTKSNLTFDDILVQLFLHPVKDLWNIPENSKKIIFRAIKENNNKAKKFIHVNGISTKFTYRHIVFYFFLSVERVKVSRLRIVWYEKCIKTLNNHKETASASDTCQVTESGLGRSDFWEARPISRCHMSVVLGWSGRHSTRCPLRLDY